MEVGRSELSIPPSSIFLLLAFSSQNELVRVKWPTRQSVHRLFPSRNDLKNVLKCGNGSSTQNEDTVVEVPNLLETCMLDSGPQELVQLACLLIQFDPEIRATGLSALLSSVTLTK